MNTKSRVLSHLIEQNGDWIPGERLATSLNLSRTAIWKAIKSLRNDGYHIDAVNNRGYSLHCSNDILSCEGMLPFLHDSKDNVNINIFKSVDSTNNVAKKMAIEGVPHGTFIFAEEQSNGRGRKNRAFYSPTGKGIYMTTVLRPSLKMTDALPITAAASVAVCRAIKKTTGINAAVKWVNDILIGNKKVCGILTEATGDLESGAIEFIILGIGINFIPSDFPDDIKDVACSLLEKPVFGFTRNELAAELIEQIMSIDVSSGDFIDEYRESLGIIGKYIDVTEGALEYSAKVEGLDDKCGLIVSLNTGETKILRSAEITIRQTA